MEWEIETQNLVTYNTDRFVVRKDTVTIGRSDSNDIAITNEFISRNHLILKYINNICEIEDLKSANGSLIRRDNKWEEFAGKIQTRFPCQIRLGREIALKIQLRKVNAVKGNTTVIQKNAFKSYQSGVINLKELKRERAIMVLDICESTRLASKDDAMAFHQKKRLESISKFVLYACNVSFVKNTGDGFIATFPNSLDALKAGKGIIKNLTVRNERTHNPEIDVRIGLHKGITYMVDSATQDVHGNDVNIAFRVEPLQPKAFRKLKMTFPEKNRILCTKNFYEDLRNHRIFSKFDIAFCGSAKLRGIDSLVDIYWIQ